MREIKFRAWDKKTKKIRQVESIGFGILSPGFGGGYPVCNMKGYNIIEQKDICIHRDSPDFELMQYTGLKERFNLIVEPKCKEIYEGDVIRSDEWEQLYLVAFDDGKFIARRIGKEHNYCTGDIDLVDVLFPWVVGNIYENKNLLEVEHE